MSDWDNWLTQDPDAFVSDPVDGPDEPDPDTGLYDEPDSVVDEYDR